MRIGSITLSMTVNYLGSAPNEDAVAYARVTKRGGRVQYSEVKVRSASTNVDVAEGLVTHIDDHYLLG